MNTKERKRSVMGFCVTMNLLWIRAVTASSNRRKASSLVWIVTPDMEKENYFLREFKDLFREAILREAVLIW